MRFAALVRVEVQHRPDELVWVVVDLLMALALHRDDCRAGNSGGKALAVAAAKNPGLSVPRSIRTGTVMLASPSVAW